MFLTFVYVNGLLGLYTVMLLKISWYSLPFLYNNTFQSASLAINMLDGRGITSLILCFAHLIAPKTKIYKQVDETTFNISCIAINCKENIKHHRRSLELKCHSLQVGYQHRNNFYCPHLKPKEKGWPPSYIPVSKL